MKYAVVGKNRTGYWEAVCKSTGKRIGGFCDSELEAYKKANSNGYLVV